MALFAPPAQRPAVAALFGVDAGLGRIALRTSEPMAGLVRFAWWREALVAAASGQDGRPSHLFLEALAPCLRSGHVPQADLLDLLEAHEALFEARRLADVDEAVRFADRTGARAQALAMRMMGGDALWVGRAHRAGRALALLRLAADLPRWREAGLALPRAIPPVQFVQALAAVAAADLAALAGTRPPRPLLAPMLALRLARDRLRRLERAGHEPERLMHMRPAFPLPRLLLARLTGRP